MLFWIRLKEARGDVMREFRGHKTSFLKEHNETMLVYLPSPELIRVILGM